MCVFVSKITFESVYPLSKCVQPVSQGRAKSVAASKILQDGRKVTKNFIATLAQNRIYVITDYYEMQMVANSPFYSL